jgi:hypothetical protein
MNHSQLCDVLVDGHLKDGSPLQGRFPFLAQAGGMSAQT